MVPAELTLTTDAIIFIGTVVVSVISILLFLGTIDKRITILETNTLKKDEFYEKLDEMKESIITGVKNEINNCKLINHED